MTQSLLTKSKRKSMMIRPSGRSTDFITPSFGFGCYYNCSYCYLKRHKPKGLDIATNTMEILTAINNHVLFVEVEKPNQTHDTFVSYDISCNEDFSLHAKYHDWQAIFDFFKQHPIAMGSFATKYVNNNLLNYNPNFKVRIRFSLMPQHLSTVLEPNTSTILDRIKAIDRFITAGYDVHINFSPVVVYQNWLDDYATLFKLIDKHVSHKDKVKCEVIFLTHNKEKHEVNLANNVKGEHLLWNPSLQENKTSQYGGVNVRYKRIYKDSFIKQWTDVHNSIIPWDTIRYIF